MEKNELLENVDSCTYSCLALERRYLTIFSTSKLLKDISSLFPITSKHVTGFPVSLAISEFHTLPFPNLILQERTWRTSWTFRDGKNISGHKCTYLSLRSSRNGWRFFIDDLIRKKEQDSVLKLTKSSVDYCTSLDLPTPCLPNWQVCLRVACRTASWIHRRCNARGKWPCRWRGPRNGNMRDAPGGHKKKERLTSGYRWIIINYEMITKCGREKALKPAELLLAQTNQCYHKFD